MARRPFFGQGPAPQIARMDMQAATAPGRAYAAAFQKLGDIASDTLEKFREKKEEKEREDNFERMAKKLPSEVFSAFGVKSEEEKSDFIKSIKKKGPREDAMAVMSFYQKAQDAQTARDVRDLQMDQLRRNIERQKDADLLAEQERMSENQFFQKLPSLITDPQAQRQADIAMPGLASLGNGDARNRFMEFQLQDPRNQKRVLDLNDQDFLDQFKGDPQQIERALAFIENRNKAQQGTVKTMNVFDPSLGKNVIAVQNPDGTPGRIVGLTPSQPKRIRTPEEEEKIAITTARNQRGLEFAKSVFDQAQSSLAIKETAKEALGYLDDIETGGISEAKNSVLKLANSIGIPLSDALKMKIGKTESFMSATGEFLFQSIQKTKGSISDSEMRIFKSINPDIAQTKEGNRIILNYFIQKADRDQELADYVDELEVEGVSPTEIQRKARKWLEDNDRSDELEGLKAKSSNTTMPKSKIASTPAGSPSSKPAQNPKFDSQIQQVLQKSSSGAELTDEEQKIIDLINKRELQSKR